MVPKWLVMNLLLEICVPKGFQRIFYSIESM